MQNKEKKEQMSENQVLFKSNLIQTNLKMHIIAICTFPVFDPDSIKNDIYGYIGTIRNILDSGQSLSKEEEETISEINKLGKILRFMLTERINLHHELARLNSCEYSVYQYDNVPSSVEWNTPPSSSFDTQGSGEEIKSSPFERKNRIPKEKLDILEKWYDDNVSYPYLTTSATKELTDSTQLSSSQVRNWVSNRRRKEKTIKTSKGLESLLSDQADSY